MMTVMMAMMILMMMRTRRTEVMVSPNHMRGSYASRFLDSGKGPPHPSVYRTSHQGRMVISLFCLPPPCTDKHRTPMPHCPQIIYISATKIPQVSPTSYSSPQIAHNPFWWICFPTLASRNKRPAHYLNNSKYYQG